MATLKAAIKFRWWVPLFVRVNTAIALTLCLSGDRLDRYMAWCAGVCLDYGTKFE